MINFFENNYMEGIERTISSNKRKNDQQNASPTKIQKIWDQREDLPASSSPLNSSLLVFQKEAQRFLKRFVESRWKDNVLVIFSVDNYLTQLAANREMSSEEKLGEIALLSYLFEKKVELFARYLEQEIPQGHKLGQLREFVECALVGEVDRLKEMHSENCPKKLRKNLPTGKTHYLLTNLSELLLTKESTISLGGIHAVLDLLNTPLGLHFRDEHRSQIISVLRQLILNESLRKKFNAMQEPHAAIKDQVRLVLKIPSVIPITAELMRKAALMTMLSDLRQHRVGNCAGIATLNYLIQSDAELYFDFFSWVCLSGKVGAAHCPFPISISELISALPRDVSDFDKKVCVRRVMKLTIIRKTLAVLGIDQKELRLNKKARVTLRALLEEIFLQSGKSEKAQFQCEELLLSFKENRLQQLLISVLEFINNNDSRETSDKNEFIEDFGDLFRIAFFNKMLSSCNDDSSRNLTQQTWLTGIKLLEEKLWLQNVDDFYVAQTKEGLRIGPPGRENFIHLISDKKTQIQALFTKYVRFLVITPKGIEKIETLYQWKSFISEIFEEAIAKQMLSSADQSLLQNLRNFFTSSEFEKLTISLFANLTKLEEKEIASLERAVLPRSGGSLKTALTVAFKANFHEKMVSCNKDRFFQECIKNLAEIAKIDERSLNPDAVAILRGGETTKGHAFTFSPCDFWESREDCDKLLDEKLIKPGRALRSRLLTVEEQLEILQACSKKKKSDYDASKIQPKMASDFYDTWKVEIAQSYKKVFDRTFNEVLGRIPLIEMNCENILEYLGLKDSAISAQCLQTTLWNAFGQTNIRISVYQMARAIQTFLCYQHQKLLDLNEIEKAIVHKSPWPQTIEVADLNWLDRFRENPRHVKLLLKYDFAADCLEFHRREGESEKRCKKEWGFIKNPRIFVSKTT